MATLEPKDGEIPVYIDERGQREGKIFINCDYIAKKTLMRLNEMTQKNTVFNITVDFAGEIQHTF